MSILIAMKDKVFARMLLLEFTERGYLPELIEYPATLEIRNDARLTLMDAAYLLEGHQPPPRGDTLLLGYPEELSLLSTGELTKYLPISRPFSVTDLFATLFPPEDTDVPKEYRHVKKKDPVLQLAMDEDSRAVFYKGERVDLTIREFALLKLLLERRGTPVTRKEASEAVFGDSENATNVVDVYVNYLRAKIDNRFGIRLISTVRGRGYMIQK